MSIVWIFGGGLVLSWVLVAVYRMLPSVLEPVIWADPNPLPTFQGSTEVNHILTSAKLVSEGFSGAECFAIDTRNGNVYAGVSDGTVVFFSQSGQYLGRIFFTGGFRVHARSGDLNGLGEAARVHRNYCTEEALAHRLAWNTFAERSCGRPLGLRFIEDGDDSRLLILDAYHGLFEYSLANQTAKQLVSPEHNISTPENVAVDPMVTKTPLFYNDLDVLPSGDIVFTDSSTKYSRSENRPEILDGAGRGRLFRYSTQTGRLEVLLCGLHFPNGVQRLISSADNEEEEIIFAELTRFRIIKVHVHRVASAASSMLASCAEDGGYASALRSGNYAETGLTVFSDSVPGLADNIRLDQYHHAKYEADQSLRATEAKSYYLVGLGSKSTQPFSLLWTALQLHWLRDVVGKLLPMKLVEKLIPRYGLVLVLDEQGRSIRALHDPSGRIAFISVAVRHPISGDLWIGSHSESYVGIVPHASLPSQDWQMKPNA